MITACSMCGVRKLAMMWQRRVVTVLHRFVVCYCNGVIELELACVDVIVGVCVFRCDNVVFIASLVVVDGFVFFSALGCSWYPAIRFATGCEKYLHHYCSVLRFFDFSDMASGWCVDWTLFVTVTLRMYRFSELLAQSFHRSMKVNNRVTLHSLFLRCVVWFCDIVESE